MLDTLLTGTSNKPESSLRIAILIPCYNESKTLYSVIQDCKTHLPEATVYVYDNGSSDNSIEIAKASGAKVKNVLLRGKGQVVRRMFADIEAAIYVMVDGDATYDIAKAKDAIALLNAQSLDMVVCTRKPQDKYSFPPGHALGNKLFSYAVNILFGRQFTDIFSGFRIFSKRFVKSFPAISQGFEIETEMTIHSLQLSLPCDEIESKYQERPQGSSSKLHTFKDGYRILRTILLLFIYVRPMSLFGLLFLFFSLIGLCFGLPLTIDFIHTGLVPKIPTVILTAIFCVLAGLSLVCGVILDSVSRSRLEIKRLWYLRS